MKINNYFENQELIEKEIRKYTQKGVIKKTVFGKQLNIAHISKTNHN